MVRRRKSHRRKKRVLRSRNPLALSTRRLGRRVKPSSKLYRRQSKHRTVEDN